ncbi:uncharacterized protein [Miscanthus floridulus]|uniref:uncharacterized protein n=1 Tax=Miscanthus floridulus TaxID=154761 RepID=UPI0034577287
MNVAEEAVSMEGEEKGGASGGVRDGEVRTAAVSLETLRKRMADFATERDWELFHSPRNLPLALVRGELSEIFQWKGEVPKGLPDWDDDEKEHLGEELADVLLYLVRLSDMCCVDLGKAALRKMEINARKCPVGQCKGSSKKHTHYGSTNNVSASDNANTTNKENNNGV